MLQCYESLLENLPQGIAEKNRPYQFLTERHLQAVWLEQKYFKGLKTSCGENIEVISPGIWNGEAGPDFKKAHIKIGNREYRGDIEIHLLEESWQQHGHHQDDRYNEVILHVSFWKPKNDKLILTNSGRVAFQVYLQEFVTIPISRIVQLIDLDLYPYKRFIGSGRCAHALFGNLSENKIRDFFKSAAEWRLVQKRDYLACRYSESALLPVAGIAMALGYKNNTEAYLGLFDLLRKYDNVSEQYLMALGMKACGFFNADYQAKWSSSNFYTQLKEIANEIETPTQFKLILNQVRPYNHPIRRLSILCKILLDPSIRNLYSRIEKTWQDGWPICKNKKDWRKLSSTFLELLPTYSDDYWDYHYLFDEQPKKETLTLIGDDLKTAIILNTFLPLLFHGIKERAFSKEINGFIDFYETFPAAKTGKTKYLVHRFFGDSQKGNILKTAISEQGALQLHRDFCIHYEASCSGCPFVERAKNIISY